MLDPSFGTGGIERIDLSDGRGPANAINGDQAYGLAIKPDGKLLVYGSKGIDFAEPARTDRDIAVVQLETDGDPDPTFGTAGVATTRNAGVSENPRHGLLQADGKIIATGYGTGIGGAVRPFIYRFNANGTTDAGFGTNGVATDEVGGPAPGFAEVYDVVQQGDKYVFAGYGSRSTTPANGIDVVLYRFNANGTYDRTFGDNGLFTYNRVNGADRARKLTSLSDGRLVIAGSTATADASPLVDALILVVKADGSGPDTSVGQGGALIRDLGGNNDSYFGLTTVFNGTKVVAAGYRAGADSALDESVLTRADLPPAVAGPTGPTGPAGPGGGRMAPRARPARRVTRARPRRAPPARPVAAGPAGPAGARGCRRLDDQPRQRLLQADGQAQEQGHVHHAAGPQLVEQGHAEAGQGRQGRRLRQRQGAQGQGVGDAEGQGPQGQLHPARQRRLRALRGQAHAPMNRALTSETPIALVSSRSLRSDSSRCAQSIRPPSARGYVTPSPSVAQICSIGPS